MMNLKKHIKVGHINIKNRDIAKKIDKNNKIIFKIIAVDIPNKKERWAIEAQYAHDTKDIYWHTAPDQSLQYVFYDSIIICFNKHAC